MEIGISTLYNKLTDTEASYCCLCYKHVQEEMCSVQDVVFSVKSNNDINKQDEEVSIHYILQQILGDKVAAYVSEYDPICDSCTRSAISSYNFITMCRENTESMANSVDAFTSNLEHTERVDMQDHKTLFLLMDVKKSKYTHYYDTDKLTNSKAVVYKLQTLFRPFTAVKDNKGNIKYRCTKCPSIFVNAMNAYKHFNSKHEEQVDPCFIDEIKNNPVDDNDAYKQFNSKHEEQADPCFIDEIKNYPVDDNDAYKQFNSKHEEQADPCFNDEIKKNLVDDNDAIHSADMSNASTVPDWNALYSRDNVKRLNELSHEVITTSDGVNKYKCRECGIICSNEGSARRHFKRNHVPINEIEKTKVGSKKKVQSNKSKIKKSIPAYMTGFKYCRDKTRRLNELSHTTITDCEGNVKYKCKECETTFLYSGTARKHYLTFHVEDIKIEGESYIDKDEIKTGSTNKNTEKKATCIYCNKCYENKYILIEHLLKEHGVQNTDTCSDRSKDIHVLNKNIFKHIYTLVRDEDGCDKYCCNICLKTFKYYKTVRDHFNISHVKPQQDEENHYICCQCGKEYKDKHNLSKHEVLHTHSKLACEVCNKVFKTKSAFNAHACLETNPSSRKNRNVSDSPFICDICGKSFMAKVYLRRHIKNYHMSSTGPRKYPCPLCSKMLSSKYALKEHQLTHTGEKNFSCDICGEVFGSRNAVTYHTRIHTGETPYPCSYCDRRFLSASRRSDHVKRHHIAAMATCPDCGVTIKQTSLRKHKRKNCSRQLRGSKRKQE